MAYSISIITPFHNVDMKYFTECVASMRRQTIGFERIEWIIVVHNCEPHYYPELQVMFKDDPNVVLKELNNEFRTPSSPRNQGLALATAPYIGLLDGDDCYTDNCIEVCLRHAEETDADMVNFRREVILASAGLLKVIVKSLFNNTERRTVMEQGHWDTEKMFGNIWGISTSYFFRTEMLRRNHIFFDNGVLFAEDFLFTLHCVAHANRVCYLNQFVGYKYVINADSLVQNPVKPAETVLTYAKGYRQIFDAMLHYGIDYSLMSIKHLAILSHFILHAKGMTLEIRQQIKELLGGYVVSSLAIRPNKLNTHAALADDLHLCSEVILNPEKTMEAIIGTALDGIQELKKILQENIDTDIARRNNFGSITTLEAYQFRQPLSDTDFYRPLIELQTRVGEDRVFSAEPIRHYFRTASGALIPCTDTHLYPYNEAVKDLIGGGETTCLLEQSRPIEAVTNDDADIDTLDSLLVKNYFSVSYLKEGKQQARLAAPVESYFDQGDGAAYRSLVLHSLAHSEVDRIVAFTAERVVSFFDYVAENWPTLLEELPADTQRKQELQAVFEAGFEEPAAAKIWPCLRKVIAFGAGEHYEAFKRMRRYIGDVPYNHGYYFTEETIFGKAVADGSNLFECIRGNDFYELIPLMDDSASPVCWTKVEQGKPYQLVVTNRAGLYRYVTDHFILPQEVTPQTIRFTIY